MRGGPGSSLPTSGRCLVLWGICPHLVPPMGCQFWVPVSAKQAISSPRGQPVFKKRRMLDPTDQSRTRFLFKNLVGRQGVILVVPPICQIGSRCPLRYTIWHSKTPCHISSRFPFKEKHQGGSGLAGEKFRTLGGDTFWGCWL